MRLKSKQTMKVLEVIGEAALETAEIWLAIMTSPYGSSHGRIQQQKEKIQRARKEIIHDIKERQKFYELLAHLKKDGLAVKKEKEGRKFWQLTKKGKEEYEKLRSYYRKGVPPHYSYKAAPSDNLAIIIFDVPEKEKGKRDWLRRRIAEMGFKKLQESVWAGKYKVPEEFVKDLDFCGLLPCVEIFTVNRRGTLRKLSF